MIRKGKRKSATACLAVGFILACYLARATDCYRLKKTERREGRKEADAAKTIGFQEGTIVFGRVFEKGLESQVLDGTREVSSNASAEDEAAYQADFTGWSKGQAHDTSFQEASWKRMAPSLQCGADQLKFRAMGPGASQFAVEQGNAPPMPLSQVPSTCGYSMQRNSLALVMLVPFDGCNMVQEGGSYMLPMRWQGIPVSLLCPKPAAPAEPPRYPPSYPKVPQIPLMPHIQHPEMNPKFPPYFFPPYSSYPQYPPATTTTTTKKPEQKPQMPKIPQYPSFFPHFYPYFPPPLPVTTAAPTTTAATTTSTAKPAATAPPPAFPFPFYPPFYPPFPWPLPGPMPTTPAATTTPPTTTKPASKHQMPQFPPFFPVYPPFPLYPFPPNPYYPTSKPQTTATTTVPTTTTTTVKTDPILTQVPPHHPHFHPHVHLPPFPFLPYPPNYPLSG
ncbi:vegetative cell wall protein gp1-like [Seriola lalandi dorsalis]|uniref:vegetative cell wall protein gp1-like n=1 Tax=Seriola lalandi dorsalis TaxID=1841481 RepID=UPI000C6FB45E|nr:vegetative cell wall protein gp1-like [Seriola lalandi dorsalis]